MEQKVWFVRVQEGKRKPLIRGSYMDYDRAVIAKRELEREYKNKSNIKVDIVELS
jgi:hypothetical protein